MALLLIAEHDNTALKAATLNALAAAHEIAGYLDRAEIHVLVAGQDCAAAAHEAAAADGVTKVIFAEHAAYANQLPEALAPLTLELTRKLATPYSHILAAATTTGKNLMPRLAALLDVAQISDISAVESADTFVRPIYAGNALARVQSSDPVKVITVRATAFDSCDGGAEDSAAEIENCDIVIEQDLAAFVDENLSVSERPELTSANIVISGGRGMQNGENFVLLEKIADKLNAAIGASRAAVDAGFVPNDMQVGQTGKIVAPNLYIAVGISGAIQHLAGMKDSKVIVAINKDAEAPIFQVADYGLAADLFKALPELEQAL